ncbi:DUF177 domain-containing protein [Mesorhizobium sp. VNQ89]
MDDQASPVSFKAFVSRLPQKGMPVVIDADARQREALSAAHGVLSVERFHAELNVTPWKRNGVKVSGYVEADITQECVVTLEPLKAAVREDVTGLFLPADSKLGRMGFGDGGEIHIDADGPDSPETFTGDTIDVGALAEEFFGLALDPYPRKDGALLESKPADVEPVEAEGPLQAKLRKLVQKD